MIELDVMQKILAIEQCLKDIDYEELQKRMDQVKIKTDLLYSELANLKILLSNIK